MTSRRAPNDYTEPCIVVGMHGQWTDIKADGPVLRKGSFKFPLFGDSLFQGELLNGRRFGPGVQVYLHLCFPSMIQTFKTV